jgi:hypothetical protein
VIPPPSYLFFPVDGSASIEHTGFNNTRQASGWGDKIPALLKSAGYFF